MGGGEEGPLGQTCCIWSNVLFPRADNQPKLRGGREPRGRDKPRRPRSREFLSLSLSFSLSLSHSLTRCLERLAAHFGKIKREMGKDSLVNAGH